MTVQSFEPKKIERKPILGYHGNFILALVILAVPFAFILKARAENQISYPFSFWELAYWAFALSYLWIYFPVWAASSKATAERWTDKLQWLFKRVFVIVIAGTAAHTLYHGQQLSLFGSAFNANLQEGTDMLIGATALAGWGAFALLFSPVGFVLILLWILNRGATVVLEQKQAEAEKWSKLKA